MATVPPLPYIPLEVGENIIDQLDEHVDSLRSCALTCRGWSRHARQHLIASIRIQSREDLYSICDYITSTPRISSFIRSVSLTPAPTAKKPRFFLDVLPVHLLMRLPNLQRYCIADYRDAILFHSIALVNLKAYVLVRELRLERVRFHTGAELARFLIALPQLRRLECHEVRSSAAMTAGPARFRDKCPKLSEVAIWHGTDVHTVGLIIQMSFSALNVLQFDGNNLSDLQGHAGAIDLSELKHLQSLDIMTDHCEWVDVAIHQILSNDTLRLPATTRLHLWCDLYDYM